jgi:hypothetical protein
MVRTDKHHALFGLAAMKHKGVALGLTLTMLVCTSSFSAECKDAPVVRPAVQIESAGPFSELQNQDTAFSILIEAFRQIQGRIIQNDYEACITAANALSDLETHRSVVELAKQERELREAKLDHQIGNLNLAYDQTRRDDAQAAVAVDVRVPSDTGHAAKTLMDDVFIAPSAPDKDGEIKTTTVPIKDYLLDKTHDPVD